MRILLGRRVTPGSRGMSRLRPSSGFRVEIRGLVQEGSRTSPLALPGGLPSHPPSPPFSLHRHPSAFHEARAAVTRRLGCSVWDDIIATKRFLPDAQVVAWEDKEAHGRVSSRGSSGVMRYGVVIIRGAGEGATEDDDASGVGAEGNGTGRNGKDLRYLRIKTYPGRVQTFLSSQVKELPRSGRRFRAWALFEW